MVRLLMWCPPWLVLLHVILPLWLIFSSNKAACIRSYGLMGPYSLPQSELSQTPIVRQPLGTPYRISFRRFWYSSKTHPNNSKGFPPTPPYQRTLTPAQCHCHFIKKTTEVLRKWCPALELQFVTTSTWVSAVLYYFHRPLVCESVVWAVNIIHKASWRCSDKVFFLLV